MIIRQFESSQYVLTINFNKISTTLPANTSKGNQPIRYTAITIKKRQCTNNKHNTNEISLLIVKKEVLKKPI
jgi:hypothetical protein